MVVEVTVLQAEGRRPCFLYPAFAGLTVAMQYPRGRESGTTSAHSELLFGLTPVPVPAYIRRVVSVK